MCGIAGMIDLSGRRAVRRDVLTHMARTMTHRGPDEDGFLFRPGIGLAHAASASSASPTASSRSATRMVSVSVVFNGEFFDYPEQRKPDSKGAAINSARTATPNCCRTCRRTTAEACSSTCAASSPSPAGRGRRASCCSPATASASARSTGPGSATRRRMAAVRLGDQGAAGFGHGAREARSCAASTICSRSSRCPGRRPVSQGVNLLTPGHYLRVSPLGQSRPRSGHRTHLLGDRFPRPRRRRLRAATTETAGRRVRAGAHGAVERRLRADVPVVSYLSGGVDSSIVVALASHIREQADPHLHHPDQGSRISTSRTRRAVVAKHIGADRSSSLRPAEVLNNYPRADLGRRRPGHRHVVHGPADAGAAGAQAGLQGRPDRRRRRRMAGRLSVVQGPQAIQRGSTSFPACRSAVSFARAISGPCGRRAYPGTTCAVRKTARRQECLARHLRPDWPVEAAFLQSRICCRSSSNTVALRGSAI